MKVLCAFGPLVSTLAPGTIPSDAFQRVKLSSSASSWAYSSVLFATVGLYPWNQGYLSVTRHLVLLIAISMTWSEGGLEIILVVVLLAADKICS